MSVRPSESPLLAGLDEAVERVRKSTLIDKPAAADAAFSALRSVLAQLEQELIELRIRIDQHIRRGH